MRQYSHKAETSGEFQDIIEDVSEMSLDKIRDENYMFIDNSCYWAKKIGDDIFYSLDDPFDTEKLDATHIVAFLK